MISLFLFEFYNQKLKPEGFAQRCSVKRAVLKISENSEEITELVSLFSKVSSLKAFNFIKRWLQHNEISKNTYFLEPPRTTTSLKPEYTGNFTTIAKLCNVKISF